jgi:guanylate kinase
MSNKAEMLLVPKLTRGRLFIVSAPAGTGKTTLVRMLNDEFPNLTPSISCTTRPKRANEVEGQDYHFISKEEFKQKITENAFVEHVEFVGNHYGTLKQTVEEQLARGEHLVLTIDVQGALLVKKKMEAITIFLKPPSVEELRRRLEKRQTESEEQIQQRIRTAELELAQSGAFDYCIINDDLNLTYQILKSVIIAETHKT